MPSLGRQMGLNQFVMILVPREKIGTHTQFTVDEFNAIEWWSDRQPPQDFRKRFCELLPPTPCPYEDTFWWGMSSGNNIEVGMRGDSVEDVVLRSDCCTFTPEFSLQVLNLAGEWSCRLIYRRYFTVLPEDPEGFLDAIRNRFVPPA